MLVNLDKEIMDSEVNVQDRGVQDELTLEVIILGVHEDLEITTHEVMILNQVKDDQEVHENLEIDDQDVLEVQIALNGQFLGTKPK